MTCIVGIAQNGKVWIGGDSASVQGWLVRRTALPKVFRVQNFLIGYTSSFRFGQILQYHFSAPKQNGQSDIKYLVTVVVPEIRQCMKEHWFENVLSEDDKGGRFLLGYNRQLYRVDMDFQVNPTISGYDACGSGQEFALSVLYTHRKLASKKRILKALKTAAHFCGSVCKPFVIEVLK